MSTKVQIFLLVLLVLIQLCLTGWYVYYHKTTWTRDILQAYYIDSQRFSFTLSPYGPGFEKELLSLFSSRTRMSVELTRVDDFEQGLQKVQTGQAQVFIPGPLVPDKVWPDTVRGPGYLEGRLVVAHNKRRYGLNSLNDLCQAQVVIPDSEFFSENRLFFERDLECSMQVHLSINNGQELFQLLSNRMFRFGLVDELNYDVWHAFYPEVLKTYTFDFHYEFSWIWGARHKNIHDQLSGFWAEMQDSEYLHCLADKYFGFFPETEDAYQLRHFFRAIDRHLPDFAEDVLIAAQKYRLDPLLLIALIYQESHFDPYAESRTGVRGLLQITADTAEFLGVANRLDPAQSIMGGAKYLRFLADKVHEQGVRGWDKWFLTLAAYNQGLGHLYDAMELSERQGKTGKKWCILKEVYPLLSYTRYYETLPRGYARGFEAVTFVENIRYYYYLLYGMASLSWPEAEDLGRLLGSVPAGWPDI
ncbi:MAG: transglycosylase SLT domain-containing protein [Desulfonatronovibrionaceae bacterium]